MQHKPQDLIQITEAPPQWRLSGLAQDLIHTMRKTKLVPKSSIVVVSISCVGARAMSELNMQYRRKRGTTDILSFEQKAQPPGNGIRFLGDMVICIPVVEVQAREHGHSQRTEAAILLVHGFLHLLGFDHEKSAAEFRRMARAEQKLVRAARLAGLSPLKAGLIGRSTLKK